MSKLPSIPPSKERNLTVDKLKELVEIWKGERGNALDQVITRRDLVNIDIARISRNGGIEPVPSRPPELTRVSVLENLTATGGFGSVFLEWGGTNQVHYSYTEIHRSSDNNLANAILIGTSLAPMFVDAAVNSGQGFYYWVRAVSTSGWKSDFNATNGTYAEAVLEPDYVIGLIQGLISESELAQELLTPIQSIPSIQQILDDHGIRIPDLETYIESLKIDVPDIKTKLANYLNIPPFDSQVSYSIGQIAIYNGFAWRALSNMTAPSPTPAEGLNWTNIGTFSTYDGAISSQALAINDVTTTVTDMTSQSGVITLLDNRVFNVEDTVGGHVSAISALNTFAQTNGPLITSHGESINSIQASLNDLTVSEFDANFTYELDDIFKSGSTFYKVIATQTPPNATPPNATYYEPDPNYVSLQETVTANASALGALTGRVEATEDNIAAQSQDLSVLDASISTVLNKEFSTSKTYPINSVFSYSGSYYKVIATQTTPNVTPPNAIYYQLLTNYSPLDVAVSANAGALGTLSGRVDIAEGKITSQAVDVSILESTISTVKAAPFSSTKAYSLNTIFSYNSVYYKVIALQTPPNATPPNATYYQVQTGYQTLLDKTEASSTALGSLTSRVDQTEDDITAQSQELTILSNYIETGENGFDAFHVWHFDTNLETWTVSNATQSQTDSVLSFTTTTNGTTSKFTKSSLDIDGGIFYKVRAKVRRLTGSGWTMRLYYQTSGHGYSSSYYKSVALPTGYTNGEWISVEWDMSALSAGGTNWIDSQITGLRIDFSSVLNDVFQVDWIAVGRQGPGGSSRSIAQLTSDVSQVDGKITATNSDVTLLRSKINTVVVPVFSSAEVYKLNDYFKVGSTYYKVIQTQTPPNLSPPNASYYQLQTDFKPLDEKIEATSSALNLLDDRVEATENSTTANASNVSALEVSVSSVKAKQFDANKKYAIDTVFQYSDVYYRVIQTQTGTNATPPNATYYLALPDYKTLEDEISGYSQAYDSLNVRVEEAEGKIISQASKMTALGSSLNEVIVFPFDNQKAYAINDIFSHTVSNITSYYKVIATQTGNNVTPPNATYYQILSGFVPLQATVYDQAETIADMDGNLSASRVIKVDANGRMAGIGLYSDTNKSEFIVASNSMYFIDPNASVTPFVPNNNYASMDALRSTQFIFGYAKVEGQNRFAINVPAYIPNATITDAQIQTLNVGKLTGDKASFVTSNIGTAAITNAMIGNVIQSNSYVPGFTGWKVDKNGSAEFNDIKVYDPDGRLAFATGQKYLITSDNPAQFAWLSEDASLDSGNSYINGIWEWPSGIRMINASSGNIIASGLSYIDSIAKSGLKATIANGGTAAAYTFYGKAISLIKGKEYKLKARIKCRNPSASNTPSVRLYAAYSNGELSAQNAEYVMNTNIQDICISGTLVGIGSTTATSNDVFIDIDATYTYPIGGPPVKYFSPALQVFAFYGDLEISIESLGVYTITPLVSSTYIADAAITEAKIKDAAIKTLKIDGGAVTAIKVTSSNTVQSFNSHSMGWTQVFTMNFNHLHSETVPCIFVYSLDITDSRKAYEIRAIINGVTVYEPDHTYVTDVQVFPTGGGGVSSASIKGGFSMPSIHTVDVPSSGITVSVEFRAKTTDIPSRTIYLNKYTGYIQGAKR